MAKQLKQEPNKHCDCDKPELINKIAQTMQRDRWFDFCKKCQRNRWMKPIYKGNNIVGFK